MDIGILGGTFDPIHLGHLLAAECARDQLKLDEIWIMPSHVPPHKEHQPVANPQQRLEMAKAAIKGHTDYKVLDIELQRSGASYTLDTIKQLKQQFGSHKYYFIIGGDMIKTLHQWDRIEQLMEELQFVGCQRAGVRIDWNMLPEWVGQHVLMVEMPLLEISSTLIRERIKNNNTIRFFVPDHVHAYIEENRLYEAR